MLKEIYVNMKKHGSRSLTAFILALLLLLPLSLATACRQYPVPVIPGETTPETTEELPETTAQEAEEPFYAIKDGKVCRVTVTEKNSSVSDAADKIAYKLGQAAGVTVIPSYTAGAEDETEIIVGRNEHPAFEELYSKSALGYYYVYRSGTKLFMWSTDLHGYEALIEFVGRFAGSYYKDGDLVFDELSFGSKQYFKTAFELPVPDSLTSSYIQHTGGTDTSYTCVQIGYTKASKAAFDSYIEQLKAAGFELKAENSISSNLYYTFIKGDEMLTVIFYPSASIMRIIAEPKYEKGFWEIESGERSGQVKLMMIKDETGEHPSSFVITLADGRYFIFDTGVETSHTQIFEYMEKNNRFTDGKVHIAAIAISHPHPDHMNGLISLANTYADKIVCDAVWYNLVSNEMQSCLSSSTLDERHNSINTAAKKMGAAVYCLRAGQKFNLSGTTFEVLFTPDELGSYYLSGKNEKGESDTNYDMNNSSVIIMMTEGGQQTVFTGDCRGGEAGIIQKLFAKGFPGDIIASAHHGFNVSATLWLYTSAKPSVILWTIKYTDVDRTRYFVKQLEAASYVKKHFYEDEQVELTLPYTP